MPLHARSIPGPASVPGGPNDPARVRVALAVPLEDPPAAMPIAARPVATSEPAFDVETSARPAVSAAVQDAATTTHNAAPWPWYRREPWLSVMLAAFAPIGASFAAPPAYHFPLIAMSVLLVILSTAMLIRQGPFQAHPRPELPRDAERRAKAPRQAEA